MIEVHDDHGEITSITINGEALDSDDGEVWFLPKGLVAGLKVSDLPDTVAFEPCKFREDSTVILDSIPMRLRQIAPNKVHVEFEDGGTRKYWDGDIGFKVWMEAKRATIEEREKEIGDIHFESYDDDGAYIWLIYSSEIETESVESLVQLAEQIVNEVDGAAELRLGGRLVKASDPTNEADFTVRVVLPILRKLGFANIKYNHGKREYGKDIVFARLSEFQELEHWAAQVKYGDVDGGAGSEIDKLSVRPTTPSRCRSTTSTPGSSNASASWSSLPLVNSPRTPSRRFAARSRAIHCGTILSSWTLTRSRHLPRDSGDSMMRTTGSRRRLTARLSRRVRPDRRRYHAFYAVRCSW